MTIMSTLTTGISSNSPGLWCLLGRLSSTTTCYTVKDLLGGDVNRCDLTSCPLHSTSPPLLLKLPRAGGTKPGETLCPSAVPPSSSKGGSRGGYSMSSLMTGVLYSPLSEQSPRITEDRFWPSPNSHCQKVPQIST